MAGINDVLSDIRAAGLVLSADRDQIVVRPLRPEAVLTTQLRKLLAAHKPELLALLRQRQLYAGFEKVLANAQAKEAEIATAYETKGTLPGGEPPYQRLLAQQTWLASIGWSRGLRCGLTGQQCRACKGIPCHGSTEW